jgi:predicted nucleic acid-binding Zn ribbon protein
MSFEESYYRGEEYDLDKVSKTTPLSIELSRLMGKLDPEGKMSADGPSIGAVQKAWSEIAGEQVSEITRSVYLRENEVVVILSSPLWAQELNFLSSKYCEKLNSALGVDTLTKVSFRVR